jgi:hypothetical protein
MRTRSRRTVATVVWALAVWLLIAGCGGGKQAGEGGVPVAGSFVGMVGGGPPGVAVVADKPAAQGQPRKVSVYLCDGRSINLWLTGQTSGNQANLASESGKARASVTLAADGPKGAITLPGGKRLDFTSEPASGVAGLYNVTIAANGAVRGASQTGGKLTGRVRAATSGSVVATITAAGGQEVKAFARQATPGAYRLIVFSNGNLYGGKNFGKADILWRHTSG